MAPIDKRLATVKACLWLSQKGALVPIERKPGDMDGGLVRAWSAFASQLADAVKRLRESGATDDDINAKTGRTVGAWLDAFRADDVRERVAQVVGMSQGSPL
jgi:hypothetical protein